MQDGFNVCNKAGDVLAWRACAVEASRLMRITPGAVRWVRCADGEVMGTRVSPWRLPTPGWTPCSVIGMWWGAE
jgi:hypothetical protein